MKIRPYFIYAGIAFIAGTFSAIAAAIVARNF